MRDAWKSDRLVYRFADSKKDEGRTEGLCDNTGGWRERTDEAYYRIIYFIRIYRWREIVICDVSVPSKSPHIQILKKSKKKRRPRLVERFTVNESSINQKSFNQNATHKKTQIDRS
jgi:hypothetical protein